MIKPFTTEMRKYKMVWTGYGYGATVPILGQWITFNMTIVGSGRRRT